MFCATVSEGSRLNAWNTNRSRLRTVSCRSLNPASSVPPSPTVPEVGRSNPAATFKNVLLPEPDGPITAVNDPAASATLTPSSAATIPSPRPYTLRTSRRATTGGEAAVPGVPRVDLNMKFPLFGRAASIAPRAVKFSADCLIAASFLIAARAPLCAPLMHSLVVPCREPKVRPRDWHRREAGLGFVRFDDSRSYLGRRRAEIAWRYVRRVSRFRYLARKYWFDLLVALLAIVGMLEVALGHGSRGAPKTTLWFCIPAIAVLVLPVFARRRFPFAGPAVYWLLGAGITFVDP